MKNFEKYEKEIKELAISYHNDLLGIVQEISGRDIPTTLLCFEWLYEEYREPLLTEEERKYLKAVIKPYIKDIANVCRKDDCFDGYIHYELVIKCLNNNNKIILPTNKDGYKNLKPFVSYTLKELGLED